MESEKIGGEVDSSLRPSSPRRSGGGPLFPPPPPGAPGELASLLTEGAWIIARDF